MDRDEGASGRVDRLVTAGVDVGMGAVKVVLLAHDPATGSPRVLASEIVKVPTRRQPRDVQLAVREGWWRSLRSAALSPADVALVASTGQERAVAAHIGHFYRGSSLATGVRFLFPGAVAVLDIGVSEMRCTRFETPGRRRRYATTPRGECWGGDLLDAAPTPGFLVAYQSLARRASELMRALAIDGPTAITGTTALDATFLGIFARRLIDDQRQSILLTSPDAVFAGAYGAALLAAGRFRRAASSQRAQPETTIGPAARLPWRPLLN